jgi:hypothetical protein
MAVSRIKTSSVLQGFPKSRSLLAGNSPYIPPSFESIATITLSSSTGYIEFTSIPSTYKHLQVRIIGRSLQTGSSAGIISSLCNSDQTNSYSFHLLNGNGSAVASSGSATQNRADIGYVPTNGYASGTFGTLIVDVIDYASTTKYKTIRAFSGFDGNGSGTVGLGSGLWQKTNAVNAIAFSNANNSFDWAVGSTASLYGIKG